MAKYPGPDDVVVPLDQLMKAPVSLNQDDPRLVQVGIAISR